MVGMEGMNGGKMGRRGTGEKGLGRRGDGGSLSINLAIKKNS